MKIPPRCRITYSGGVFMSVLFFWIFFIVGVVCFFQMKNPVRSSKSQELHAILFLVCFIGGVISMFNIEPANQTKTKQVKAVPIVDKPQQTYTTQRQAYLKQKQTYCKEMQTILVTVENNKTKQPKPNIDTWQQSLAKLNKLHIPKQPTGIDTYLQIADFHQQVAQYITDIQSSSIDKNELDKRGLSLILRLKEIAVAG